MFLLMVVRLQGILSKRLKISRKGELSWKFSHLNLMPLILMKLLQNFSVEVLGRLHVMPFGLFDKDEKLSFAANGTMGSAFHKHGEDVVSVIALDQHKTFSDVSVIKMDIEGSELAALRGAEQLIRKNHPRLAVCIYHRSQDIVEIYQFLRQFEYRFYLRQHAFSAEETVLYAI